MFLCRYSYVCTCYCTTLYLHQHVRKICMYIYIQGNCPVLAWKCVYVRTYMHIRAYTGSACMNTYIHIHNITYIHIVPPTYTYITYIHTYIHTGVHQAPWDLEATAARLARRAPWVLWASRVSKAWRVLRYGVQKRHDRDTIVRDRDRDAVLCVFLYLVRSFFVGWCGGMFLYYVMYIYICIYI